jgi:hypothetical protein
MCELSASRQPYGMRPRAVLIVGLFAALLGLVSMRAQAQDAATSNDRQDQQGVVNYPAEFFARYQPNTALEMVQQIPGFQLDDGSGERGFGTSAGNILINDRRLSAKQDRPSSILDRIPASRVERIDLIRGQVRSIDMLGQSVVANVVLRGDVPAAMRWEASVLKNFLDSSIELTDLATDISRSDRWRDIDYNTGVTLTRRGTGDEIVVDVLDGDGDLIEERSEEQEELAYNVNGNLNLSTTVGRTLLQLNSRLSWQDFETTVVSDRTPVDTNSEPRQEIFGRDNESKAFEIGVDAERSIATDLIGKGILLFFRNDSDTTNTQRSIEELAGQTRFRVADANVITTETITRLEFEWAGWRDHAVKLNIEGALNSIDGSLVAAVDTGAGPVMVDVPGGNTRVEELRGDILLNDTWSLGEWVVDYGLGAELSEISQTGDANRTRDFFFVKPQALAIWSPSQGVQTRLRVAREVAQLNLSDFVTTTQFQDDNLLRGGQDLEPESTWVTELTYEQRFGELGVVSLMGFHHWISDAQDFVPLTDTTDAPGNIGDGRRWGVAMESTLSLEGLGLTGARLDLKVRWQDSTVVDPVTGLDRILTGRSEHQGPPTFSFNVVDNNFELIFDIAFRQDFEHARVAWGWDIADRGERTWFKVDELNVYDEDGIEMNVFVETTRWLGVKFRLEGSNLNHFTETRDRALYVGRRGLSPVSRRELTEVSEGRRLILTVSGSF